MATFVEAALLCIAASWIALIFHELGHALAAWLVGVRVWGIRLGLGPLVWHGQVRGCRVQIGVLPILGSIQLLDADASAIGYRDIYAPQWRFEWGPNAWRAPIISLAGGLSNLVGLLTLVVLWDVAGRPGLGTLLGDLLLFGMASNFAGYLNLLPWFRSDGTHLIAHVRAARTQLSHALSA
jgi:membrane-associated protease RseP (regulator of RpoE activity)